MPNLTKDLPLKNIKLWIAPLVVIATASILGIVIISNSQEQHNREQQSTSQSEEVSSQGVSALGYIAPKDRVVNVSGAVLPEVTRLERLLVTQGEQVQAGQIIAILDNYERLKASLNQAKAQVAIARSKLVQVTAGTKDGEIQALVAKLRTLEAELQGQMTAQNAIIKRLNADLAGNTKVQQAASERVSAELTNAKAECERFEQLYLEGATSKSEYELTCLARDTALKRQAESKATLGQTLASGTERVAEAEAQLQRTIRTIRNQQDETRATLSQVAEVRGVDVSLAKAELTAAIAGVERATAELNLAYVKAPRPGQVLKIHTWPGETISPQGILALGQTQTMYVVAERYETDISQVRKGQTATISADALPEELQGTVTEVGLQIGKQEVLSTDPSLDTDARIVEVKIRLSAEDSAKAAALTNLQVKVVIANS
ncbi:MAG: HlyD family efflux transporter periplasmic adaptor subunit [Cyanophyceae cyanobacterium]